MNFLDPLSDSSAPRYALESDDEDEINPLSPARAAERTIQFQVKSSMASHSSTCLIVVSGGAGKAWASGAPLGEQVGSICVNGITVGMMFEMKDQLVHVVVSEATTTLPIWAMHSYAEAVLDFYNPSRLVLFDSYPVPSYVSSKPLGYAPSRFLQTHPTYTAVGDLQPFESPNLIQSTSAAFMTVAAFRSVAGASPLPASLLLLPSPRLPRHRPTEIVKSLIPVQELDDGWPLSSMREAHACLLQAAGHPNSECKGGNDSMMAGKQIPHLLTEVGEGGLYM